jgi:hypothetical protein
VADVGDFDAVMFGTVRVRVRVRVGSGSPVPSTPLGVLVRAPDPFLLNRLRDDAAGVQPAIKAMVG